MLAISGISLMKIETNQGSVNNTNTLTPFLIVVV